MAGKNPRLKYEFQDRPWPEKIRSDPPPREGDEEREREMKREREREREREI
jgi:hypothetical protein